MAVIFATLSTTGFSRAQDKPVTPGWEYKILRVRQVGMDAASQQLGGQALTNNVHVNSAAQEKFLSELDEAGKQGWELVGVVATADELSATSSNTAVKAFLKRRLH